MKPLAVIEGVAGLLGRLAHRGFKTSFLKPHWDPAGFKEPAWRGLLPFFFRGLESQKKTVMLEL